MFVLLGGVAPLGPRGAVQRRAFRSGRWLQATALLADKKGVGDDVTVEHFVTVVIIIAVTIVKW